MSTTITFAVLAVLALIVSGVIGAVKSAVSSISRARVEQMVKTDQPGASRLLRVVDRRADHINLLVLLGILLDASAAVCAAACFVDIIRSDAWACAAAIGVVSLISFVVVGVLSRTIGRTNPYSVSLRSALALGVVTTVLGPIARLLIKAGNVFTPGSGFRQGPYASEIELREMVDIAQERGVVETTERRMIQNVFDLGETIARQIMVPRPEIIWIEETKTAGQATNLAVRSGHSRIPVIGENTDDIVGVVYVKDLVERTYHLPDGGRSVTVSDIMRPAMFIPDSKPLDETLRNMQALRNHIAMLVDEYGGLAGMITLEDILEEIVGEISDEYDDDEVTPIEKVGERTYRVVSRLSLEDLTDYIEDTLGEELEFDEDIEDQVDTVAGLISFAMGRVPLPGTKVDVMNGRLTLTAEGGHDRRGRVRVRSVIVHVGPLEYGEEE